MNWFNKDPELLKQERKAWEDLGFPFNVDTMQTMGIIQFEGSILFEEEYYHFEIHYPQGFPFLYPRIKCTSVSGKRHQTANGWLCLHEEWVDYGNLYARDFIPRIMGWLEGQKHGFSPSDESLAPEYTMYEHLTNAKAVLITPSYLYHEWKESEGEFTIRLATRENLIQAELVRIESDNHHYESVKIYLPHGQLYFGVCYNVDEAPPYCKNADDMITWLEKKGFQDVKNSIIQSEKTRRKNKEIGPIVGIRYPEEGNIRFLVMSLECVEANNARITFIPTVIFQSQIISHEQLFSRVANFKTLDIKHAAVVGVGAIGASVALELAKAGIGCLTLVDHDTIHIGNVVRHIADMEHVGMAKVDAVKEIIKKHNPYIGIETRRESWGYISEDKVNKVLEDADIVISAVGHSPTERYIDDIARRKGKPVIYAYASAGAISGRVFRVIPGETGCYHCHQYAIDDGTIPRLKQPNYDSEIYEEGCAGPSYLGSGIDTNEIAMMAARLCIQTLLRNVPGVYEPAKADHIWWSSQLKIVQAKIRRQINCPFCTLKENKHED